MSSDPGETGTAPEETQEVEEDGAEQEKFPENVFQNLLDQLGLEKKNFDLLFQLFELEAKRPTKVDKAKVDVVKAKEKAERDARLPLSHRLGKLM